MTTYEGGVRVPMLVRWPGEIPAGSKLNGIQGHQDLFTTLAAAAGIENEAEYVMKEMDQYIDGVNNLDYWRGSAQESARNHIFHYYESKLTALRMDPYESYDSSDAYGHLMQKVSWLIQPMGVLMQQHLRSLKDYPPVQGGSSFDMSNVVEEFINKARQ
jgi:arylsulfatase